MASRGGAELSLQQRITQTQTMGNIGESMIDNEVVPSSLVEIAPILRVANEVEPSNPRVAYICRFYAFEKAHQLDPTCSGRGVRQFKTSLQRQLEREDDPTLIGRVQKSDAREMQSFYQHYYKQYIQDLQNDAEKAYRAELTKAYQTENVLFEVYRAQVVEADIEIGAVVYALQNTSGLPWPKDYKKKKDEDILDWLQAMFGFQLDECALNEVMKKLLKNYKKWCKYLDRKTSLWLPTIPQEVQQRKLLYMGLHLLIWGEAANLRFMPECLCYFYHYMAFELYGVLAGNVSPLTGENIKPAYGGEENAFLRKVVTPIDEAIAREAARSRRGKAKHSQRRIYDDLNKYFWSVNCFRLGWPMRADADFFCLSVEELRAKRNRIYSAYRVCTTKMRGIFTELYRPVSRKISSKNGTEMLQSCTKVQ